MSGGLHKVHILLQVPDDNEGVCVVSLGVLSGNTAVTVESQMSSSVSQKYSSTVKPQTAVSVSDSVQRKSATAVSSLSLSTTSSAPKVSHYLHLFVRHYMYICPTVSPVIMWFP